MTDSPRTVRLVITGRVQGVSYRDWTCGTAEALGLSGWVRNRTDGSVEAVASGASDKVDTFIEACRTGPAAAKVDNIEVTAESQPPEPGFRRLAAI